MRSACAYGSTINAALSWVIIMGAAVSVQGNAALWNSVLSNSCPFEFNPADNTATTAEQEYIGMWVGHEYDPMQLREGIFTTAKVSAFNNQPWTEAVACGKMMQYGDLSADCQSLIRQVSCPVDR